jgi:hypothetical protein
VTTRYWDDKRIEPWYRQNIFWARREPHCAGREPRLKAVINPEVGGMIKKFDEMTNKSLRDDCLVRSDLLASHARQVAEALASPQMRFLC